MKIIYGHAPVRAAVDDKPNVGTFTSQSVTTNHQGKRVYPYIISVA